MAKKKAKSKTKTKAKTVAQKRRDRYFWEEIVREAIHQGITPLKAVAAADYVVGAAEHRFEGVQ